MSKSLLQEAKISFKKIENMLYEAPSFIEMIESNIPKQEFRAILTDEQNKKLAQGTLKLMTRKDGNLMADLVDPKTNQVVSKINLEKIEITPDLNKAINNYTMQMQMAQIAEEIQNVQIAIEEVRQGQEFDRLALAYSSKQKFLQAKQINNKELKTIALMKIVSDAEDSRNLLMLSQNANLNFIKEQPESFWGKFFSGDNPEKINQRIKEIRESLLAVNMVSLVEAMAYYELGEINASRLSLQYYAEYIQEAYLSSEGLVDRLDSIDPSNENYWSKKLPEINKKIKALPYMEEHESLLEG